MSASLRAAWISAADFCAGKDHVSFNEPLESEYANKGKEKTHIVQHLIAGLETFGLEELLKGLLLFAVDVAKLMIAATAFCGDCDIKRSACGDGTANPRHDDDGDVVEGNVCGWFGDEHEALVQTEEMTFVGFDAAFDARLLMMTEEVFGWSDDFLPNQSAKDLSYDRVLRRFITGFQLSLVLSIQ